MTVDRVVGCLRPVLEQSLGGRKTVRPSVVTPSDWEISGDGSDKEPPVAVRQLPRGQPDFREPNQGSPLHPRVQIRLHLPPGRGVRAGVGRVVRPVLHYLTRNPGEETYSNRRVGIIFLGLQAPSSRSAQGVAKLEDASLAGTSKSAECHLLVTEGTLPLQMTVFPE